MQGLMTVFQKELADHFTSWRFIILFAIIFIAGIFATYVAAASIRETVADTHFVFLRLFTTSTGTLPSFLEFIVFLVPIVGIILGFDAINSEKNSGTLSRLLSQPIYRDAVINGKFLAGVVTMAVMLLGIFMLVSGMGLRMIGVPPSSEEVTRLLVFLISSIMYGAFWLGLAMLFSIFLQRVATSAMATIAIWIFFIFFMLIFAGLIADAVAPVGDSFASQIRNEEVRLTVMRLSPLTLFRDAVIVLLIPGVRTLGLITQSESAWMIPNPLSLGQSLMVAWPHLVGLLALTVICFAISYIRFMREEIRST